VTKTSRSAQMSTMLVVVVTAYLIFIFLGIPDGMLGVAWPSMRANFGVDLGQMGVLLMASTVGFLITSFSVGRLIARLGIVGLLMIAVVVRGAALLGMGLSPEWWVLVAAAFCFGIGSGAIDASMNTYFAMNLSPRLMNWLHASFGLGATLGPILMTALLSAGFIWRAGYITVGLLQAALAILIFLRADAWEMRSEASGEVGRPTLAHKSYASTLRRPLVWVNIALFLVYAGTEVTAGNWSYTIFTESRGIPVTVAGFWASLFWGSFTIGRFLFGLIADRVNVTNAIRVMILLALAGALMIWWNPVDWVSFAGLVIMGFAAAPIFPLLVSSTPARLGVADAANAIGFQVGAASLGIALLPGLAGVMAQGMGLEVIPPFMAFTTLLMLVLHEIAVRGKTE
jgi:fucose permease